jgi:endonuclease/exonuclease/phosphatase family metal-dependent hydrolase
MTFNVENLFDTKHDEGKEDQTYLPLYKKQTKEHYLLCMKIDHDLWRDECLNVDWNKSVLKLKMDRLANVIREYDDGKGPDILLLQEVENLSVVKQFVNEHMGDLGYQSISLIEGPDKRGIDTAIISRFKHVEEHYKNLIYNSDNLPHGEVASPTRGIFHVKAILPDQSPIHLFSLHLPSQSRSTIYRKLALDQLLDYIESLNLESHELVVIGGDFNITASEDKRNKLLKNSVASDFLISHKIGCKHCQGTHNYKRSWSFLDMLFFSKNMQKRGAANWVVLPRSIDVLNTNKYHVSRYGTPERFGTSAGRTGVSDHWPITAKFMMKK